MRKTQQALQIDPQFRGPPDSGNGGYTAGLVASAIDGPCEITLRAPPPLATTLQLDGDGAEATLCAGDVLIASARALALPKFDLPVVPDFDEVRARQPDYAGFRMHNFPGCYVCGPDRAEHDGLRIFAAPDGERVVAAWQPDAALANATGQIDARYVHAALDCPSYFAFRDDRLVALLGRMHSAIESLPQAGEHCVILAWPIARDGRKNFSAVAAFGSDGRVLARARNTWIELKDSVPKPPAA